MTSEVEWIEENASVPPRMWVKITGTEIGVAIDTDPTKTYRENVRMCLLSAEKAVKTRGITAVCCRLFPGEKIVGEITGQWR